MIRILATTLLALLCGGLAVWSMPPELVAAADLPAPSFDVAPQDRPASTPDAEGELAA